MIDVVDEYGFEPGGADNNAAFAALQADIDAGLAGRIFFPYGNSTAGAVIDGGAYKTTLSNPLVIKNDYTDLIFENGARINWQPVGAGTGILWENPVGTLLYCGAENVEVRAPNNTGTERIGFDFHDVRYSTFRGLRTSGFAGSTSTGMKLRGRDRLLFMDLALQAERPLWMAQNDREPTDAGKDIDHSTVMAANLVVVSPPNPCIYFEPGYVLRNFGFIEMTFAGGPVYWVDGVTIPRRESINFYINSGRFEQFADLGPVTSDTVAIEIRKHPSFKLADFSADHVMLAPAAGNDWSGILLNGVSRASLRHCVHRGTNGTSLASDGYVTTIQCSLEGL